MAPAAIATRVLADERQAVGEHVVHLPRDARAFRQPCLLDPQVLLGLRQLARSRSEATNWHCARANVPSPPHSRGARPYRESTRSGNWGSSCSRK
ncbi:hypothetical protein GCM10027610_055540 [Dactylosporangium cerinum]